MEEAGPCSQRGGVHRRPCPLAAPALSPSLPGECSWRPKGGRQRAEVGGGEGATVVAALQQICRTAHFGVDSDSDMSLFFFNIVYLPYYISFSIFTDYVCSIKVITR